MTLHLVPFDVDDSFENTRACFINPDMITSITIVKSGISEIVKSGISEMYHVLVETPDHSWCSRRFENEADAENLMNEFIAECYAIEHGCENCSDYCCGARNEL